MAQLVAQGDIRVARLVEALYVKYSGVKNVTVRGLTGCGTGTDIIVHQNILKNNGKYYFKALELREVTNFSKFTTQGKPIGVIKLNRQTSLLNSLTRRVHKLSVGPQVRVYSRKGTKLFFDVSYISNVPVNFQNQLKQNGINIMVWGRTETPKGYKIETSPTTRRYFKGIQIPLHVLGPKGH